MVRFDEQKLIDSVRGALGLRAQIEPIVDKFCQDGFRNICWLGIGGTWASCMQAECHMREKSALDFFVLNAAEYCVTGDKRVGEGTVVIISSVTGTTSEIVDAVKLVQAAGAKVLGFIDKADAALASMVDFCISYMGNEQLKFFMTADRFMFNAGEFDGYEAYYAEMDQYLPEALVAAEKSADEFGRQYALDHMNDELHYFVGAGALYGATYSYAMCYWEEQHWIRTKSITAEEFFHGMLEIVDKNTAVTVFLGEDEQRPLAERVAKFLPRVCGNYTLIDAKDYAEHLEGISPEFRGSISHLVTHAVTQRIDAHMEVINRHPVEIRRYYRQFDY